MPIFKPDEFLLNILPKKRLLGIDHGTKTLGIAISNSDMTVASPIKTIKRDKKTILPFTSLNIKIRKRKIGKAY